MTRRGRFRRLVRVAGASRLLILIPAWALSTQYSFLLLGSDWMAQLWGGVLRYDKGPMIWQIRHPPPPAPVFFKLKVPQSNNTILNGDKITWAVLRSSLYRSQYGLSWRKDALGMRLYVPLWTLAATATLAIAVASFCRPRCKPGHCLHCGYNLTGNVSGICPECGVTIRECPDENAKC